MSKDSVYAGEPGPAAGDGFAAANTVALRARVRELEVETGLMQRELDHVSELAERQSQQLQYALCPIPFLEVLRNKKIKKWVSILACPIPEKSREAA